MKKEYNNLELYSMIKSTQIRQHIVKSPTRIKFLFPPKKQFDDFVQIVSPEIEKQKKLLAIKRGEYR